MHDVCIGIVSFVGVLPAGVENVSFAVLFVDLGIAGHIIITTKSEECRENQNEISLRFMVCH